MTLSRVPLSLSFYWSFRLSVALKWSQSNTHFTPWSDRKKTRFFRAVVIVAYKKSGLSVFKRPPFYFGGGKSHGRLRE